MLWGKKIKENHRYCHSAYLTYIQSTSCEMLGWMKHKLESRWQGYYKHCGKKYVSAAQGVRVRLKKIKKNEGN